MKKRLYGASRTVQQYTRTRDLVRWLRRGAFRSKVFRAIDNETMPSAIVAHLSESRRAASRYAQVSRALAELEAQGLVQCRNPLEKTGRVYRLTRKGKQVQAALR